MNDGQLYGLRSRQLVLEQGVVAGVVLWQNEKIIDVLAYGETLPENVELIDVGNNAVMPGLVDTHVHVNEPGRTEWEGFNTATRAAAAGGITTLVDMPLNCDPVTTSVAALKEKIDTLDGQLWVDCGFWGGAIPGNMDELDDLVRAGVLGVKSFTIDSGLEEFPPVSEEHLRQALSILADHQVPYLIHAELDKGDTPPAKITDKYQTFLDSRPKRWENDAIQLMIGLLEELQSEGKKGLVHIVHLSSADAIEAISHAREKGLGLTTETCPHYLTLFSENIPDGKTLFKCCPPIREDHNRQQLWQGLKDGHIDFIVSDHSPCTPQLKHIDTGDLDAAWGGISSLQFGLSLIWSESEKYGFGLHHIAKWMCTEPAAFAGLGDCKGKIEKGYDADLIVFDGDEEYTIQKEHILFRHKMTPYEGRKVRGRVKRSYLRGQVILDSPVGKEVTFCEKSTGRPILKKR
ncbi:allantoinase AllB [Porticoccus sp. W117]|uniref:allantoinase AllB n=1 Tax=Porticoccus sp. W117 TaxID=3054777 RepID=UPI002591E9F1|nr:allantoinase AllB [Porticoccus sp. W117]MDM3872330.1 allantoinase AllB [Porticoccus sp. W117]